MTRLLPKAKTTKLTTIRDYRRARGLCEVRAEKWVRGHKCAATVSLQAMQEVMEFFHIEPTSEDTDDADEQLLLALSHDACTGSHGQCTIRFHGTVYGLPVVMLIDSGSSSFLAASIADQLPQLARVPVKASVKIANGQIIKCTSAVLDCQFSLQEHSF